VQSLALQTLRSSPDPQEFGRAFGERLQSLSRAHDLLPQTAWQGAPLGKLVELVLEPFNLQHRRIEIAGPAVDLPANVTVDARTTTGSVEIDGSAAGVIARSTNGNVTAVNVSGPVALTTTNGNANLSIDSLSDGDSVRVSTTNGNIRAELPSAVQGRFDLSTVNGMVHSNLPLPSAQAGKSTRKVQGQIGTLARLVRLHTINGMVSVTTRGAPAAQ